MPWRNALDEMSFTMNANYFYKSFLTVRAHTFECTVSVRRVSVIEPSDCSLSFVVVAVNMDSWKKLLLCPQDGLCGGFQQVLDEDDEELWNDLTFHGPPLAPPIPRVVRLTPLDDDDSLVGLEYMQEAMDDESNDSIDDELHSDAEEETCTSHGELYEEERDDTTVLADVCCHQDDDIRFMVWKSSSWSYSLMSREEEDDEDGSSYSSYGFNRGSLLDRPAKSTPTREKSQRTLNTVSTSTSTLEFAEHK